MRAARIGRVSAAVAAVAFVGAAGISRSRASATAAHEPARPDVRNGRQRTFWPNGQLRSDAVYANDAFDGEYRTYYESGAPYELRHYAQGHEAGLQQSWTEDGVLYLNYEVHGGRRFGLVNASPCDRVGDGDAVDVRADANVLAARGKRPEAGVRVAEWQEDRGLPYYDGPEFAPRWAPVAHRVAPFALETQSGAAISDVSLRGRPYVASFIYTQCAAVCPLLVRQLSRVQDAVAGTGARIVSFSVTPDADTPTVLAQFGRDRGIFPATWSLVTGSKRTIYVLARASYFADDQRVGQGANDETAFLHTEKLVLVDGDGRLRGIYNGTQPHAVDQLIADLAILTAGREALQESGSRRRR